MTTLADQTIESLHSLAELWAFQGEPIAARSTLQDAARLIRAVQVRQDEERDRREAEAARREEAQIASLKAAIHGRDNALP